APWSTYTPPANNHDATSSLPCLATKRQAAYTVPRGLWLTVPIFLLVPQKPSPRSEGSQLPLLANELTFCKRQKRVLRGSISLPLEHRHTVQLGILIMR